jgi:hypothetical protein
MITCCNGVCKHIQRFWWYGFSSYRSPVFWCSHFVCLPNSSINRTFNVGFYLQERLLTEVGREVLTTVTVFWDVTPFSVVEGRNRQKQAELLNLPPAPARFLLDLLFCPEYAGDMYARNVGLSPQYTALTTQNITVFVATGEYCLGARSRVVSK